MSPGHAHPLGIVPCDAPVSKEIKHMVLCTLLCSSLTVIVKVSLFQRPSIARFLRSYCIQVCQARIKETVL